MVTVMFELFYNTALTASNADDLGRNLYLQTLDAIDPKPPFLTIAGKLASQNKTQSVELLRQLGANVNSIAAGFVLAGNDDMAEFYRTEYKAGSEHIALAYAFIGKHEKVDEYLTEHQVDIHTVLYGYCFANNHTKIAEYLRNFHPDSLAHGQYNGDLQEKDTQNALRMIQYHELLTTVGEGYALAGNAEKAEEYRSKGASVDRLAKSFAAIGAHEQVEQYRIQHGANIYDICTGYQAMGRNIPSFYRTIITLQEHGEAGQIVIKSLLRLKQGQDQYWNPYWMNSGVKLNQIADAVNKLPQDANLDDIIKDENSELYQALNMHRLSPITFLGQLGFYHSKSIQAVTEQLDKEQELRPTL